MKSYMQILASALLFSILIQPVLAQTVATSSTPGFSPSQYTSFSLPASAASNGGSSSGNNNGNNSSNSGATTGLLVGGAVLGGALVGGALLGGSAVSTAASVAKTGLSFGGRITAILPCISYLGPSVWVLLIPAPATKQPAYIWTPLTVRGIPPPGAPPAYPPITVPDPPPFAPGQQILGIADIPYYCCLPPSIPAVAGTCQIPAYPFWIIVPGLPGQRMQWANQSLAPGFPGMEALTGTGAIY